MSKRKHSKLPTIIILAITALVVGISIILLSNNEKTSDIIEEEPAFVQNSEPPYIFDYSWNDDNIYIAHAFGGIDGHTYTNSLEAFYANYEKGYRVFEVDFNLSDDNILISAHVEEDWRKQTQSPEDIPYTAENFRSKLLYNQYHTMFGTDVIDLMAEYPDIYIVTDTKYYDRPSVEEEFKQLVEYAQNNHPETLERLIPQIYNEDMLEPVMNVYPFRSIIFTLYQTKWTPESVLEFCQRSGIRFVTITHYEITKEILDTWGNIGIKVGVHTVDGQDLANSYLNMGVKAVYTNSIIP